MKKINIVATEPQAQFYSLKCKYPAFVGGYGSGKSETMLNQAIIDASYSSEALIALYSPSYDLVRLVLAPRLMQKLDELNIKYEYNKTENHIRTESNQFGNFIMRSLDTPERIVAYESFRAHIDEIDVLTEKNAELAWNKIIARNRQRLKGKYAINRVSAYSTPEGFRFLYNRWVKNKKDGYEYVKASSRSNPMLPEDYIQSLLDTYSPELVKAYIEGEFVNLTQGTVYYAFDRFKHDSKEFIKNNEPIYVSQDFNVGKMASSIYVKRQKILNQNTKFEKHYYEWHIVEELCNLNDTPHLIENLKEKFPNNKIIIYPDASGTSKKSTNANISDIALLQQAGFEIRAPRKNPLVKDRVNAVNIAFSKGLLYVNVDKCPTVTSCLEQQSYDDNGEPDKKSGKDHQNDATGYLVAYEMPVFKPVINMKFKYPT